MLITPVAVSSELDSGTAVQVKLTAAGGLSAIARPALVIAPVEYPPAMMTALKMKPVSSITVVQGVVAARAVPLISSFVVAYIVMAVLTPVPGPIW